MEQVFQEVNEITLEGFQVVSREMLVNSMTRYYDPYVTIWSDSLTFNKAAVSALNCCESILIQVNPTKRALLISSAPPNDKDGIKWINKNHKDLAKKFSCTGFTTRIYELWDWDKTSAYRCPGRIVTSNGKVMLLFDMTDPVSWVSRTATSKE